MGTWYGTHDGHPATLIIDRQAGNSFSGTMTVEDMGTIRLTVNGSVSPETRQVVLRETRVLQDMAPANYRWALGDNYGTLSTSGRLAGVGKDTANQEYDWSFARQGY